MARFSWLALVVLAAGCLPQKFNNGAGSDGGQGPLTLTRLEPTGADPAGGFYVDLWGQNLSAPVQVFFGATAARKVIYIGPVRVAAETPAGQLGTTVDVKVVNGDGQTAVLKQAFTFRTAPKEINSCKIQWPSSFYAAYGSDKVIYGRVLGENLTNQPGQPDGIVGQVGYGLSGTPLDQWTWFDATYNATCTDCNAYKEYSGDLVAPSEDGVYDYVFRFQYQGGDWVYCSYNETADFDWGEAGRMTVGPPEAQTVSLCRLQYPTPANHGNNGWPLSVPQGSTVPTMYGRVVVNGLTGSGQPAAQIGAELGYGPAGSAPATWSAWFPAEFNAGCYTGYCSGTQEDEYFATLVGPPPGSYNYTFRFNVSGGDWTYCDQNGVTDGGSTTGLGQLTATPGTSVNASSCQLLTASLTGQAGQQATPAAQGSVTIPGYSGTDGGSAAMTIAQVGFGPTGSTPGNGWNWVKASLVGVQGGADVYQATLTAPSVGSSYDVAYRFSIDGNPFVYCDTTGSGSYAVGKGGTLAVSGGAAISAVTFEVLYGDTQFGQAVYVSGSAPELGGWAVDQAVPLSGAGFPLWTATVNMAQGEQLSFKFLVKDGSGNAVAWEPDPNRTWTVPSTAAATYNGGALQGTDGGY